VAGFLTVNVTLAACTRKEGKGGASPGDKQAMVFAIGRCGSDASCDLVEKRARRVPSQPCATDCPQEQKQGPRR
jgi:hypothetical protein